MAYRANPYGYGNEIGLTRTALNTASLILTQWSPEVLRYGKDNLVFPNFLDNESARAFGKGKGETFRVPIYSWNGVATTALTEGTSITLRSQTVDSVAITIAEYGDGISYATKDDYISNINNSTEVQRTLADTWASSMNALAAEVFDSSKHGAYTIVSAGSYTIGTNLTSDAEKGTGAITGTMVDGIYDKLRQNKVRPFPNGLYVWIGNSATFRPIKREAGWENLQLYNRNGAGLTTQVLGAWKGFLFIETEEWLTAQKSYAFGQQVGAYGFAKPMSIYYYPDFDDDAGRNQVFKWYSILGLDATLRDKGTTCLVIKSGMA